MCEAAVGAPSGPMKEIEALLDISKGLRASQSRQEVLYLLVKAIASVIQVTRCSVIVVSEESGTGKVLATYEDPALSDLPIDLGKYPEIQEAVTTGSIVLVEDVDRDSRMRDVRALFCHLPIASILVIPIIFYERVLGTLFLRTSHPQRSFTREEILFCETASRMAGNFLLGLTQYESVLAEKARITEEAMRDPLTGLANRASFSRALAESLAYAKRHDRPLACLMIDADDFKAVNDRHGHRKGDEVLKAIAAAITGALRKSDVAARYGGDEFSVLLRDTDGPGAYTKAERIREAVRSLRPFETPAPCTVSIGISVSGGAGEDRDLVAEADRALYAAKAEGKDRTVPVFEGGTRPDRSEAVA